VVAATAVVAAAVPVVAVAAAMADHQAVEDIVVEAHLSLHTHLHHLNLI
jgi:hypothetical protein